MKKKFAIGVGYNVGEGTKTVEGQWHNHDECEVGTWCAGISIINSIVKQGA